MHFDEASEDEQKRQRQWDELLRARDPSIPGVVVPAYDLENHRIVCALLRVFTHSFSTLKVNQGSTCVILNEHPISPDVETHLTKPSSEEEGIVNGDYERYYQQDDLLLNAATVIERVSVERTVLDRDEGERIIPQQRP